MNAGQKAAARSACIASASRATYIDRETGRPTGRVRRGQQRSDDGAAGGVASPPRAAIASGWQVATLVALVAGMYALNAAAGKLVMPSPNDVVSASIKMWATAACSLPSARR